MDYTNTDKKSKKVCSCLDVIKRAFQRQNGNTHLPFGQTDLTNNGNQNKSKLSNGKLKN